MSTGKRLSPPALLYISIHGFDLIEGEVWPGGVLVGWTDK